MAIARKPQTPPSLPKDLDAWVGEAGSDTPIGEPARPKADHMVSLRLPRDLLERLDQNRMARLDKPTRGAWIKAAIAEKLDRV
ncbi:hypothetical protein CKO38_05125 [Rhodospirillum rubrum]|uniref:ribbon-helix-helix protein, CopG family n=1 Tax=Rhodospirillum rubrum TaxID=1085 RepID=UPI001906E798|nr:ribbon-helix-helix protein, CopG family [Rhodospirillum rubrum]MBK1664091.1 hypothetical protein [Rhodospirillum rubrum]MBK1676064.1 hypothetical protein [Rhodospirillum rubrum]